VASAALPAEPTKEPTHPEVVEARAKEKEVRVRESLWVVSVVAVVVANDMPPVQGE